MALSHLDESCAVCVWTGSGKDGCGDEERGAKERAKEPRHRGAPPERRQNLKGAGRATPLSDAP